MLTLINTPATEAIDELCVWLAKQKPHLSPDATVSFGLSMVPLEGRRLDVVEFHLSFDLFGKNPVKVQCCD